MVWVDYPDSPEAENSGKYLCNLMRRFIMRMLYNTHPEQRDQEIRVLGVIMRTKCNYID